MTFNIIFSVLCHPHVNLCSLINFNLECDVRAENSGGPTVHSHNIIQHKGVALYRHEFCEHCAPFMLV